MTMEDKKMPPSASIDFSKSFFPRTEIVYSWEDLFGVCIQYRMDNEIPADEQVFLLTDKKIRKIGLVQRMNGH